MSEEAIIINQHYAYFPPFPVRIPYLTFNSSEEFTLKSSNNKQWNGTLYYSTDAENWTEWNGTIINSSGGNIYLRGKNNTYLTGGNGSSFFQLTPSGSKTINCSGNIENLLDWEEVYGGNHPTMANSCFNNLFYNCSYLGAAPDLPALTLTKSCYKYMFAGCSRLTAAPALPATNLAEDCYLGMFYSCTALVTAPALPATTLAEDCYQAMFIYCTALVTAPALPATTLAAGCYSQMFASCTSLSVLPKLSTTLNIEKCASHMFLMCSSVMVSETQTGNYQTPLCSTTQKQSSMFSYTGGTYTGDANAGSTYYTSNRVV